jgi:hypothetical protein
MATKITNYLTNQKPTKPVTSAILFLIALTGLILGFIGSALYGSGILNSILGIIGLRGPTNVRITLSPSGETANIPVTGGVVKVKYHQLPATVTIPKNALVGSSTVSVTSISAIDGLNPGSQLISGIDVSAGDGQLLIPATLTFTIPESAKGKKLAAYAYDTGGKNFHLYPVKIQNDTAILNVLHFSGYGIITVNGFADQPYSPTGVGNQTLQYIANITYEAGMNMATGRQSEMSPDQLNRIANLMRVWYKTGVTPKLDGAGDDPTKILDAGLEYNDWRAHAQLYGVEDKLTAEVKAGMQKLITAIKNNVDKAYRACKDHFDANQAGILIKLAALAQKFASDDIIQFDSDYINKLAQKCANFTLRIKSVFKFNDHPDANCGLFEQDFEGEFPLIMDNTFNLSGNGHLTLTKNTMCGHPCRVESGPDPMTTQLNVPNTIFNVVDGNPNLTLHLEETGEDETRFFCPFVVQGEESGGSHGDEAYLPDFFMTGGGLFVGSMTADINGWQIINQGGIYARKEYQHNHNPLQFLGSEGTNEYTIIELIHRPL